MTTVLQYLVIAAVIGLILFGIALLLFGRGERLSALPARTSPAQLPERGIDGGDVRRVRFALALRGYRMSDVDWTLERLADELDRTRAEVARLSPGAGSTADPESTAGGSTASAGATSAAGSVTDAAAAGPDAAAAGPDAGIAGPTPGTLGGPAPMSTHPSTDPGDHPQPADHQAGPSDDRRDPNTDAAPPARFAPQQTPGTEA